MFLACDCAGLFKMSSRQFLLRWSLMIWHRLYYRFLWCDCVWLDVCRSVDVSLLDAWLWRLLQCDRIKLIRISHGELGHGDDTLAM